MPIAKLSIDMEARLANIEKDMARVSKISEDAAARIKGAFSGLTLVFTGLAGALSVGAIKGAFDKYVEGAAKLDDFSEKVGASVENLSKLAGVAKISGTDMGLLESGLVRLSAALSKSDDEAKGAGKAFAMLGLDPEQLQLMDSAEALQQLAERFAELEDSSGKTALAMAIFGKGGAQLLPYLKDLAGTGDLVAKVTTQQAAAAEEYEKNLKRLEAAQGAVAKTIVAEMLPAANRFVESMVEMINGADGVNSAVKDLAKDGSLREWGISAARAAAFVVDEFQLLKAITIELGTPIERLSRNIYTVGALASIAVTGSLDEKKKAYSALRAENEKYFSDLDRRIERNRKPVKLFSDILEENLAKLNTTDSTLENTKRKVRFSLSTDKGLSVGAAEKNRNFLDYDAMLAERIAKAIGDTDTVKAAELVRLLGKLDELAGAGLDPRIVNEIRDDLTGATKAAADELARLNGLLADTPTAKLQELQGDMMFLTEALNKGYVSEQQYLEAVTTRLEKTGEKAREAADAVDEFARSAARNMQSSLADFLFDPFKDGVDGMAANFGKMIRRMIAEAVAADLGKRLFGDLVKGGEGKGLLGDALGWLGGIFKNADGGVYPGAAGLSAYSGTIVSQPTVFPFAKGIGLMGEKGPEAILPLKRGADGKLGVAAGGGSPTIIVNVNGGTAPDVRRSAAQGAREGLALLNGARRYT